MIVTGAFVVGSAAVVGAILLALGRLLPAKDSAAVDAVLTALPRVECAQCGYAGCRPYAEAIVERNEALNKCPPGGEATVERLAKLLGRSADAVEGLAGGASMDQIAVIDAEECIGCYRCIEACPVDAIVGAPQYLHAVLDRECTGCELCLAPCPVDCISLVPRQ